VDSLLSMRLGRVSVFSSILALVSLVGRFVVLEVVCPGGVWSWITGEQCFMGYASRVICKYNLLFLTVEFILFSVVLSGFAFVLSVAEVHQSESSHTSYALPLASFTVLVSVILWVLWLGMAQYVHIPYVCPPV
jgi:hypothetical protein